MSDNLKTLKYYNKTTSQKVPLRISTDQIENTEGKPLTQILVPTTSATGATNAANAANANTASSAIRSYYTVAGVCSTAAATAQKDVTIANASTNSSAVITVLFTQKNTAANPTLCLNGGTAHKICTYSAVRPTAFTSGTNQAVSFMFYGTAWRIVHPGLT